ncbi:hypothetical protein [Nocardioides pantholopis]|uniref:hypothetical protein n=1 Tax=Nocardioides pantholopis TaxID=2483798 RepID=UPI000F092C55|nr:hypothetical protein [Nocardioides pantholopis]
MSWPFPPGLPGPRDLQRYAEQLIGAVPRMTAVLAGAEALVVAADGLLAETRSLMARIEGTRLDADQMVRDMDEPFRRLIRLLDALEPSLLRLQPMLERLSESTSPHEVDSMVALIDRLPALTDSVESDVLPVLRTLRSVAPDLHDLLDISRELNELLLNLPGMGRIRKRVEEQQDEDAAGAPG